MKLPAFRLSSFLKGLTIYSAGDTAAALLTGGFSPARLSGIMAVGGLIYAREIPAWFDHINDRYRGFSRAGMAVLYFNPLWIARHLAFISLFSGRYTDIRWELLALATKSFAANLPVAFAANYLIQNRVPLKWRFFSSAVFSSIMAIYYPLCRVIFK